MKKTDYPSTRNYPPLHSWLNKHNAQCAWELEHGPFTVVTRKGEDSERVPAFKVSSFLICGAEVIVKVYANRQGWNLYTPHLGNNIPETLTDAEQRLKL